LKRASARSRLIRVTGSILIVADDDGREMYAEYLRAHGFVVCEASGPEEAHRCLNDRITPDVVITDLEFAGDSTAGEALIRDLRFRLDDATSIIVVCGFARGEDRDRARAAGADMFLLTPALPSDVLYEVRRALILRRSGRRLQWNWRDKAIPGPLPDAPARRRKA